MPRKRDTSGSSSSPEKNVQKINIEGRRSLRVSGRSNLYPNLPNSSVFIQNESSCSPVRNHYDRINSSDEETEQRPRAGSYSESPQFRLNADTRASPSPVLDTPNYRHKTPAPSFNPPKAEKNNSPWIIYTIIALVVTVFAVYVLQSSNSSNPKSIRDCSLFLNLQDNFPGQDRKLFKSIRVGVEGILNGEPMVVSLFSTDMNTINKFMQQVIEATQKCINQSEDPISLTSDHLNSKMVEDYKEELSRRSIMIINNVENAQASDVTSLHSFCDTYNPLVSKSIIFITIQVPASPPGKPIDYITDFLNQRWKTLPDHVRNPLITRMLDQTFFLKP